MKSKKEITLIAKQIIQYTFSVFKENGLNVEDSDTISDMVWGATFTKSFECVKAKYLAKYTAHRLAMAAIKISNLMEILIEKDNKKKKGQ